MEKNAENKMFRRNVEEEIDLLQLLMALKQHIWAILAAAVICGGIAGAYSKFVITPQYRSTSMMYILSKETTLTSLADLQIGSQLTEDYKIMVVSRPVLTDVIRNLQLDLTYEQLKSKISINNPTNTRILSITVQDPDPYLAREIANTVAQTSSDYIGDIMEMIPPKLIEEGVVAQNPISPDNRRNAMMGAMAGIVLVCGIVVLGVLLNDTVQTEEDVEKYLGLTVLASVPEREEAMQTRTKKSALSKKLSAFKRGRSAKKKGESR